MQVRGRPRIRVNGRDVYLGPFGTAESKQEYACFIAENYGNSQSAARTVAPGEKLTIAALSVKYSDFTEAYYVKNGAPTDEKYAIKAAIDPLVRLSGNTPADEFGPKRPKAVRDEIKTQGRMPTYRLKSQEKAQEPNGAAKPSRIGDPLTRKYVNYRVACIVRIFRWAVEEELILVTIYESLKAVTPLRKGRVEGVTESKKIKPVPDEHIPPVLKPVSPQLAAMIQLPAWLRDSARAADEAAKLLRLLLSPSAAPGISRYGAGPRAGRFHDTSGPARARRS